MLNGFQRDDTPPDQIALDAEVYGALAQQVRELAEACIRTEVGHDAVRELTSQLQVITEKLQAEQMPGPFGIRYNDEGSRPWGNAVVGLRNPVAPPLSFTRDPSGRAACDFVLDARFEGPPTLVHGGVSALILDQALGEAAGAGGKPGMTATLTLTYRRPTPLGALRAEAWVESSDGVKTIARGQLSGPDGVCVEAEGLFVLPKWARDARTRHPDAAEISRFE